MTEIQIILANGTVTAPEKLRHYFDTPFAAEESGEEFPAKLEHVWRIGYLTKDAAVKSLKKKFTQDIDYQVSVQMDENPAGGRPTNIFLLSVSCMEYLAVRANRDVFDVYRNCRQTIKRLLQATPPRPQYALPQSYKEALQALLGEVEQKEKLTQALGTRCAPLIKQVSDPLEMLCTRSG